MRRGSAASGCLLLCCSANCALLNEFFRKCFDREGQNLRDGINGCEVRDPVTIWSTAKQLTKTFEIKLETTDRKWSLEAFTGKQGVRAPDAKI